MLKIDKLEKKWYRYKVKSLLLPFVGIMGSASLFVGGYFAYDKYGESFLQENNSSKVLAATKIYDKVVEQNLTTKEINSSKEVVVKKKEVLSLEPIIPIVDVEREERKRVVRAKSLKHKKVSTRVKAKVGNYLTAKELAVMKHAQKIHVSKPHVPQKINFQTSSTNYVEIIEKKFQKSHKPREAMLLAKAYYKEGNYKKSEKWALAANKLNNSLEESWLLFAKSKAKLGKRKEAIKILISYYKKGHSAKAKELIGQIKSGKI